MSHDFAKDRKAKKGANATRKKTSATASKPKAAASASKTHKPNNKTKPQVYGSKPPAILWIFAISFTALVAGGLVALTKFAPRIDRSALENNTSSQPHFDFFTTLPEAKIEIDISEETASQIHYTYHLQAGSFKQQNDAERRKAELGFMGYQSHVKPVDHQNQRWYRVQIGPFNRSQVADARSTLFENGIDTFVIRSESQAANQ